MRQQLKAVGQKQLAHLEAEFRFKSVAGKDDVDVNVDEEDIVAVDILNKLPDNFFRWASVGTFLSVLSFD